MIITNQPEIATAYIDEWGVVAPEVHEAAMALREHAKSYARATLHNEDAAHTLLAKAAVIVTRVLEDRPEQITNLKSYLFKTYKNLALTELEKEKSRERILAERAGEIYQNEQNGQNGQNGRNASEELDQHILIQELRARMNQRTREVFEMLILGYTFEEIGSIMGKSSRAIRNNYYDQIARLKKELG